MSSGTFLGVEHNARTPEFTVFENHRKKVSFNIASEASYVYILNGQKLIKNAKKISFWRIFDSVTRQVNFNRTKIGGKRQNSELQMGHFE